MLTSNLFLGNWLEKITGNIEKFIFQHPNNNQQSYNDIWNMINIIKNK